ncbi:MAG: NINE protein [Acetobacter sp.]|nr:NINE protein [Bacteroides sp.]MCM1341307.1 NINE protein [Acetobacter sp.]MCM1433917.1 NINE protein [Clostridiales bacterium]
MYGADRFYLGDILVGLMKMITIGGFGILYIVDILHIKKKTYDYNFINVMQIINPQEFSNLQSDREEAKAILNSMSKAAKSTIKGAKNIQNTFYTK